MVRGLLVDGPGWVGSGLRWLGNDPTLAPRWSKGDSVRWWLVELMVQGGLVVVRGWLGGGPK
jgi:hypothetical protein